jgi:pyridoxal phosphate enzyme (YggS family)
MIAAMDHDDRRTEIEAGLAAVRERIDAACADSGRSSDEITLVVVTKFFPASDVRLLADLGIHDVGENRHQEAVGKAAECADLDIDWHFIGALQSNKAAAVAGYADVVHSVDRAKLLGGLGRGAQERGRDLECLVQVSLDPPDASGRSGAPVEQVEELAKRILETDGLRLRGVMGVAPLGEDAQEAFVRLGRVASVVRQMEPEATWISAGMSEDLEQAIREGATHLRIGSAVLGPRPVVK